MLSVIVHSIISLSVILRSFVILSVILRSFIMLSAIVISVVILSIIMLSYYAVFHSDEYSYAECHYSASHWVRVIVSVLLF